MGIFDFLKRRKSDDYIPQEKTARTRNSKAIAIIKGDLNRLNGTSQGLGTKAVSYVLSGQNETVLSSLASGQFTETLEVDQEYTRHQATYKRRNLFARMQPYDSDLIVRYTELLSVTLPTTPQSLSGSKKTPPKVRLFLTEVFGGVDKSPNTYGGPNKSKDYNTRVTPQIAFDIIKMLGGEPADYFDAIYGSTHYWSNRGSQKYRKVIDIKQAVVQNPEAVVKAGSRVNADGREQLVRDITSWDVLETSPFFEYVFDRISDGAKKVREVATAALKSVSAEKMETLAIAELETGTVAKRTAMVGMLSSLGTPTALAALTKHKKKEKAARVVAAIDTALAVEARASAQNANPDNAEAYTGIDGKRIDIPPVRRLKSAPFIYTTATEKKAIEKIVQEENERIKKQIEEIKRQGHKWKPSLLSHSTADIIIKSISPMAKHKFRQYQYGFLFKGDGLKWVERIIKKQAPATAIEICLNQVGGIQQMAHSWAGTAFKSYLMDYLESSDGDLRYLESIDILHARELTMGSYTDRQTVKTSQGDFLRYIFAQGGWVPNDPEDYPNHALWPYLAENLEVFDEAFGLKPQGKVKLGRPEAIRMLTALPKPPMRFFGPLLEAATGQTKAGRQEARDMLSDIEDVNSRLITLLQDSRQAVRAGTAEWMGERQNSVFVKPIKARLKKEKSELAKAAMLTALDRLGEDLSSYVGPKALIAEAETNIKKAKFDKLDWLGLDHLPNVKFKSGARVPDVVIKWWVYLAFKLKEPGGNKLFQLYLEQLNPETAQKLSNWIMDSWINYDTQRPSDEDGNKYAKQHAQNRYNGVKRWYKDYSVEKAFADLKREFMGNYLNSGAASKGILALAYKAKPTEAANRVRSYLKAHGSRTSQASSLLAMLAAKADPVSLQVVISAATRLKQKGVQSYANGLLEKVAEDKGWTMDELADRTIPTAGFDDNGVLDLPCGPEEKLYTGILTEELKIELRNPDGKTIKGLASTPDDNTKASKKQLSTSRKELKQVVSMQSTRLYEALCAERVWATEDWTQNFVEHPIMRKLVERVVWLGLDKNDEVKASFRPTAEGDYTDPNDNPVDLKSFTKFRLAHGAVMSDADAKVWSEHLKDYEVVPLFSQFGRDLKRLSETQKKDTIINDRKGWVTDSFTIRGVASKLGYDRGEAMDGGYFNEYTKTFRSAGIMAIIEFSGNCLPEENVAAAVISLIFTKHTTRRGRGAAVKLENVPPVLLSECWNDYHAMVVKGAYDEDWEKKMPWM